MLQGSTTLPDRRPLCRVVSHHHDGKVIGVTGLAREVNAVYRVAGGFQGQGRALGEGVGCFGDRGCWVGGGGGGGAGGVVGVTLAAVGGHVVPLLEAAAADLAGELVAALGVVLAHMPVQRGLLAAGEAAHLAPGR